MFQFWNEWKRTSSNISKKEEEENNNQDIMRTCSMTSDNSNCWDSSNMDWRKQKRSLSFKEDYVSFPALEPSASEVTCSN